MPVPSLVYDVVIQTKGETIVLTNDISKGLTIDLNIETPTTGDIPTANLTIYGLSRSHRALIEDNIANIASILRQDDPNAIAKNNRQIVIRIGRGRPTQFVFRGFITQAYPTKNGAEVGTVICAQTAIDDLTNAVINTTLLEATRGFAIETLLNALIGYKNTITKGVVDVFEPEAPIGTVSLVGNIYQLLQQYAVQCRVFIDADYSVNIINNESVALQTVGNPRILTITSKQLLNIPRLASSFPNLMVAVDVLYSQSINTRDYVYLQSDAYPSVNGTYAVLKTSINGTISNTTTSTLIQSLELQRIIA